MTAEPWWSVDQIAEHLGITRDSIHRWIDRKNLPSCGFMDVHDIRSG
ncbi:MAG: helix-turn-helix domain-containing protein [Halothiobacillaceae bacterium]